MDNISLQLINQASARLQNIIKPTILEFNERLSKNIMPIFILSEKTYKQFVLSKSVVLTILLLV